MTEKILEQFAKSTAVTEKDAAAYLTENSSIDLGALRNKLLDEIRRETWTYLFVMNGVVDYGESFVPELRAKLDAGASEWSVINSTIGLLTADYKLDEGYQKSLGFIGLDDILRIFEVALDLVQAREAALLSSHSSAIHETPVESNSQQQSRTKQSYKRGSTKTTPSSKGGNESNDRSKRRPKKPPTSTGPKETPSTIRQETSFWNSILKTFVGFVIFAGIATIVGRQFFSRGTKRTLRFRVWVTKNTMQILNRATEFIELISTSVRGVFTSEKNSIREKDNFIQAVTPLALDYADSVAVVCPPSPTAIATTSPGGSPRTELQTCAESTAAHCQYGFTSSSISSKASKGAKHGKKRNISAPNSDSFLAGSSPEVAQIPLTEAKTEKPDVSLKMTPEDNKVMKSKAKKATGSKKKAAVTEIRVPSPALMTAGDSGEVPIVEVEPSNSMGDCEDYMFVEKPFSEETQEIAPVVEGAAEMSDVAAKKEEEATAFSNEADSLLLSPGSWDEGEWIPAPSSHHASKEKQSMKTAGSVLRDQLRRKMSETTYSSSNSRVKAGPAKREKVPVRVPSNATSPKAGPNLTKFPAKVPLKEKIESAVEVKQPTSLGEERLGYSAVLVKNIPPSLLAQEVSTEGFGTVGSGGSSGAQSGRINNSKKGTPRARASSAPINAAGNPGRAWSRPKTNSITSTSTTATTVPDDGEQGTLSDSDNSNEQQADTSMPFQPVHGWPAMFPAMDMPSPSMLSPEEIMHYNMMMGFYAIPYGAPGPVHMPMPMVWGPEMTGDDGTNMSNPSLQMIHHPHSGLVGINPAFMGSAPYGFERRDGSPGLLVPTDVPFPTSSMMFVDPRAGSPGMIPVRRLFTFVTSYFAHCECQTGDHSAFSRRINYCCSKSNVRTITLLFCDII